MAVAFFKHEGFLCDSYFSENLLPALKEQATSDGDAWRSHEPTRDVLILEFRSDEKYFTNELNALLDDLALCCFSEISEEEVKEFLSPHQAEIEEKEPDELAYRQEYAARAWGWKAGDILPYETDSKLVNIKRFWYTSIDRNWFGVGNSAYADLPERPVLMCNKCATKTLLDPGIRAWVQGKYRGVGHCDMCGDDDGLILDRGGQGYAEGFHSGNSKWF